MSDKISMADVFAFASRSNETAAYYFLRSIDTSDFVGGVSQYMEAVKYFENRIENNSDRYKVPYKTK